MQFQPSSASEPPGPDFLQGLTQAAVLPCFLLDLTSQCPLRQLASVDSPMVRVTALSPGLITPPLHQAHPERVIIAPATNLEGAGFDRRGSVWSCLLKQRVVGLEGRLTKAEVRQSS